MFPDIAPQPVTGETELCSYSYIDLNKGLSSVDRSSFEEEKLELGRLKQELLEQKKQLSEQIAQGAAHRDSLLKEKAELVDRQLLSGDNSSENSRRMLLRALLDENRIEKERKKEEQRALKLLEAQERKRTGEEVKQKLLEERRLAAQKKKEETSKRTICSLSWLFFCVLNYLTLFVQHWTFRK